MKVEQRTVYITSDGKEFQTSAGAIQHEIAQGIDDYLCRPDGPVYWRDTCPSEVVADLLDGYVVIPKGRAREIFCTLDEAASFVAGFEDDTSQEGITQLLKELHEALDLLRH